MYQRYRSDLIKRYKKKYKIRRFAMLKFDPKSSESAERTTTSQLFHSRRFGTAWVRITIWLRFGETSSTRKEKRTGVSVSVREVLK